MKHQRNIVALHYIIFCLAILAGACHKQDAPQKPQDNKFAGVDFNKLWQERAQGAQVFGRGRVLRILTDDTQGDRHQRFIVELTTQQTLLIAHNIDLAPRINALSIGDNIEFFGVYEWNEKGGVVHWTHRDPNNRHVHGYLRFQGKKYW